MHRGEVFDLACEGDSSSEKHASFRSAKRRGGFRSGVYKSCGAGTARQMSTCSILDANS